MRGRARPKRRACRGRRSARVVLDEGAGQRARRRRRAGCGSSPGRPRAAATRSSSPASTAPPQRRRVRPEIRYGRDGEAGVVERLLGDRVGDDRARGAGSRHSSTARSIDSSVGGGEARDRARRDRASACVDQRHDGQRASENLRPPAPASTTSIGRVEPELARPSRAARRGRRARRTARRGSRPRARREAASSGPIPAGSPIVIRAMRWRLRLHQLDCPSSP